MKGGKCVRQILGCILEFAVEETETMTNNGINMSSVFEISPISNGEIHTKKPWLL